MDRRGFLAASTAAILPLRAIAEVGQGANTQMYGLIGKIVAVDGRREELAAVLVEGVRGMPGCLSYIVAKDTDDENALWVTEVWDSEASHQNSLSLPSVQEAIRKGRPLIEGFGERFVTEPVGGHGLSSQAQR